MTMTKKKILFTSHVAYFQRFNQPFMQMLRKQGHEVHYASMGEFEIEDCDKSFVVPFARSPFSFSNIVAIRKLKKIIDRENYDLIHTHTPMGSIVTRLAARAARKKGTKVIYTAHGFHFFKGAPLLNWLIYYPIEKMVARLTDTLITINREDYARAKAKFHTNVVYVPGVGVDPARFKKLSAKEKAALRSSLGLSAKDFIMIYPAELNANKNQIMLLRVMKDLVKKDSSIHLLLPGRDSSNGYHKKISMDFDIAKNVHFLGHRQDIPDLMQIADLSVSTSFREGLPVNLMEAMFAGLPIVATGCRGATELVENSVNGFVTEFNDQKFIDAIEKIRNDKKLYRTLSKNSQTRSKQYEIKTIIPQIETIYNKLIREPTRILQVVTIMNRGGLETMLMNYYRAMDRSKIQFDFLVHRKEKGAYDDEIRSLGGNIYYLPPFSLKSVFSYIRKARQFFRNHPEYKIVHAHLDALSAFPLAAAKKENAPVRIAHSHNNNFSKDGKYIFRKVAQSFIKNYATSLFACSVEAGQFMFGKKSNFTVINNAIDTRQFAFSASTRTRVRKELGLDNELVVGHIGRFMHQKNHPFLIDIFASLLKRRPDAKLLLVGNGELRQSIEQQISNYGISDSVILTGVRSDIPDLMQTMDVFVMPSLYEGLPVVSIEAQAAGLPCVFSDVITNELDVTGSCIFLPLSRSSDEWAASVIDMSCHHKRKKCIELVSNAGFDISTEARKLSNLYATLQRKSRDHAR